MTIERSDGRALARVVHEGEIVDDTPTPRVGVTIVPTPARDIARRPASVITTAVTHPRTKATGLAVVRNLWLPIAGAGVVASRWRDAHGGGRYERLMRQAEIAGDREALLEWEARDVAEKERRHGRVMDWVTSPLEIVRAVGIAALGMVGLLVLLGIVLAVSNGDVGLVVAPIRTVVDTIAAVIWFVTTFAAVLGTLATVGTVAYLWRLGRARTTPPAWMAPATDPAAGGRDVVPDEGAIVNALRNMNLPALNRKFREGWSPRWVQPTVRDGQGWRTQLLLPEGVTVEMIVNAKAVLSHNLLRLPVEVWPTEPRDNPGVLDLWVADQGSLTKPVAPWPLLTEGACDYFRGVPVGVDPRGKVVVGRFFEANWGVAGMMGSGKSTLIVTALLGASLDPLVEIDVFCMAINADYGPLKPRLRKWFMSDDPEDVPKVLDGLRELMSDLSARGQKLAAAGEPKLTRKLAEADPTMRPRVVVIDECQELFLSDVGEEAAELVSKIIAKARKYGVTLIFATPVPSADALPRGVAKVLSNKGCFAIGDHQGNDAILGTGKHRAGISATTLRPLTEDPETGEVDPGDIGTAMTVGFMPRDGLMRCYWVRRGGGVDQVTPVVQRALALQAEHNVEVVEVPPAVIEAPVDPLADVATVIDGRARMRTLDVLSGLKALRPAYYGGWGAPELRKVLDAAGAYGKSDGQSVARGPAVLAALDARTDDLDDEQLDGANDPE